MLHWACRLLLAPIANCQVTPTFCFAFWPSPCILLPTRSLDGNSDFATTLLDLQRRPPPLPLGHALREGEGNVAWRGVQTRCRSCSQTREKRRPRAVLPLRAGKDALFDRGNHKGPVPGSS